MTTWAKPNGIEIQLNDEDATVAKAKSLGWLTPELKAEAEAKAKAEAKANKN